MVGEHPFSGGMALSWPFSASFLQRDDLRGAQVWSKVINLTTIIAAFGTAAPGWKLSMSLLTNCGYHISWYCYLSLMQTLLQMPVFFPLLSTPQLRQSKSTAFSLELPATNPAHEHVLFVRHSAPRMVSARSSLSHQPAGSHASASFAVPSNELRISKLEAICLRV